MHFEQAVWDLFNPILCVQTAYGRVWDRNYMQCALCNIAIPTFFPNILDFVGFDIYTHPEILKAVLSAKNFHFISMLFSQWRFVFLTEIDVAYIIQSIRGINMASFHFLSKKNEYFLMVFAIENANKNHLKKRK